MNPVKFEIFTIMELFQRIKKATKAMTLSDSAMAAALGIKQSTFSGYLNQKRQHNLWPLLPQILKSFPQISRQWLYFEEGPMLHNASELTTSESNKYPDDPLGRIAALTRVNTHDALQLQMVFGADYSEIRPWLGTYLLAREALKKWREEGGTEDTMPEPPAQIPDDWLFYFWGHFGPNPGWIQYGDHPHGSAPKLMPNPLAKDLDKVKAQLEVSERHARELQERLGLAREEDQPHTIPAPMPNTALGKG